MKKTFLVCILLMSSTLFFVGSNLNLMSVQAQADDSTLGNSDCTGGQCGAEIDYCSASGSQCYNLQYCTEYNTPRFSSSLSVNAQAGQPFRYEVMVAQVNPNPSRSLAPWEHPLIQERQPFETGWFVANITSIDSAGLLASGLSVNTNSVTVQKKLGVPQIPDSTGLIISGVPTVPGTYSVALNSRNDLEEWLFEAGGGDNQSSTFAGNSSDRTYVNRAPSCSHGDVLTIVVAPASCSSASPEITSTDKEGQVGEAFSFQASAQNYTELGVTTERLPEGTGWSGPLSITGTPTISGVYRLSINARNVVPGCTPTSASKDITINIIPAAQCATSTPTITSSGSVSALIGGTFSGYTIQTSQPAEHYSITSSSPFPASLAVVNNGRSLEGSVNFTQPEQQFHFVTKAWNIPECPARKDVTIGFSCPLGRPNWNPASGQCTDRCTDQSANNYNQPGQCHYDISAVCNDPLAINPGAQGACRYSSGRVLCTDPSAINFGQTGSCQPRTSCGAGETGAYPNCREIACPSCGTTKMCNVCAETANNGSCERHELRPATEAKSAPNSCGLTRSLYYCPDESSNPPPPPGEQACAQPVTVVVPERQLIQKGSQCTIPWRVSSVPPEQAQFLRCVISGPNFSVVADASSGQVVTPEVNTQSIFKFVCRNGDTKVSNTASFTCRVNPRFEER